ncbi:MAG TPA: DNA-formamidopyrimidine glycosylase family protein [Actinomycetes bacterium]|nr:DNA-formamidopyrimidine glycosylase family protein [Actinomycetes bacterium]
MPEGDTVLVAAARLHGALAGERLLATDFRVPRFATADLAGQTVREVVARGKHLLLRTDAGVTLHTHFKMEGAWHLYRPRERWRGPDFQVRAVLRTAPWVAVGFRLGVCELLPTAREHEVVGHLGPDVLGADWDAAEAVRRLLADPERAIGTALLDQRALAGPGNIYKCEVCFLRGVDPWTPAGQVDDLPGMVDLLKRLMEANRASGRQVTTGDTRPGRTHWVAGRNGRPCRRCGTPVRKAEQASYDADRVTWWCPTCQPGRGPAAAPAGRGPGSRAGAPLRSARTSAPRRGGRGAGASGRS